MLDGETDRLASGDLCLEYGDVQALPLDQCLNVEWLLCSFHSRSSRRVPPPEEAYEPGRCRVMMISSSIQGTSESGCGSVNVGMNR
jgi:hypothetical protein